MQLQPVDFSGKGVAASREWTQFRPVDGRQIGPPPAHSIRFDMRSAANVQPAEFTERDRLVVQAAAFRLGRDDQVHRQCLPIVRQG